MFIVTIFIADLAQSIQMRQVETGPAAYGPPAMKGVQDWIFTTSILVDLPN